MFWVKQVRLLTLVCTWCLWCVLGAMRSVSNGAQHWCISWKFWIPCCFHNEVVVDCAVVVNSWVLYC